MKIISVNGRWKCKPDESDLGITEKWFEFNSYNKNESILLDIDIPKSFNLLKNFEIYEGVFWHFYKLDLESSLIDDSHDYLIYFKGSSYLTKVWINGQFLGENEGGFLPFKFEIKDKLKPKGNIIAVRTDNTRRKGQLPDIAFDWFNWGGIYRGVNLLILNKNRVNDVTIKTTLKTRKTSYIDVSFNIVGEIAIKWEILGIDHKTSLFQGSTSKATGTGAFTVTIDNPKLWSPDTPDLYYIKIYSDNPESKGEVLYESHFGIRQIETNGPYLYLNKKRLYMKGSSLHEEYMPYGRTIPYEKREEDIRNMKSLGFNALRSSHYSHDEDLMDVADKLGMLILEEIPVYWMCDYKDPETFKLAAKMVRTLIKRDINHPSVIWWSVGNEVPIEKRECSIFFKRMMNWVRRFDDTRLVTYVSHRMFCDLTRRHADVACFNGYFGWYYGSPRMINLILDIMRTPVHNKPWIYTEFGAGAKYGYRPGWEEQAKYSEEKQLYVLDYSIRTFNTKDYLAGWFIWIYRDFRSFLRENQYQEGYNRKGLVSGEANEKKLIYHRMPQIVNEKRKIKHHPFIGTLGWIILYPFAYLITFLIDLIIGKGQQKRMESGKKIEAIRYNKQKENK